MLETIRELAAEKLIEEGEKDVRSAASCRVLPRPRPIGEPRSWRTEGQQRHELVIPERDNLRDALTWALESG